MYQSMYARWLAWSGDYQSLGSRSFQVLDHRGQELRPLVRARRRRFESGRQIDRELPDFRALHAQAVIRIRAGQRELAFHCV